MGTAVVDEALAPLRGAVERLLEADLGCGPELVGVLTRIETQRCRLDAVDVRVVAGPEDGRVACGYGRTSAAHAEVIEAALQQIDDLPDATVIARVAESFVVDAARHEDPRSLRRSARILLDRLDPDGVEPRDDAQYRRRGFTLGKPGDGTSLPSGRWTAEATVIGEAILDSLARLPRRRTARSTSGRQPNAAGWPSGTAAAASRAAPGPSRGPRLLCAHNHREIVRTEWRRDSG